MARMGEPHEVGCCCERCICDKAELEAHLAKIVPAIVEKMKEARTMNATPAAKEPDVQGALERLGETALQVKRERDMLFAALKAMLRHCNGCSGTGETVSWSMDGPPLVACPTCKDARAVLKECR